MKLFYVSTGMGCCIMKARDEDHARKQALIEVGTMRGVREVREATESDIAWVRGMGGRIPKLDPTTNL